MGVSINSMIYVTAECTCDACGMTETLEYEDDLLTEGEVLSELEASSWVKHDGMLYCPKCAEESFGLRGFIDKCNECTRRLERSNLPLFCPHYKKDCEDVFNDLSFGEAVQCPDWLPIGGVKREGPKYQPVENCSLDDWFDMGVGSDISG